MERYFFFAGYQKGDLVMVKVTKGEYRLYSLGGDCVAALN